MFLPNKLGFTKYAWYRHLQNGKAKIVLHGFIEIVSKSERKRNKLLVGQGRNFYNNPMQK